jgi:hypothetical protein
MDHAQGRSAKIRNVQFVEKPPQFKPFKTGPWSVVLILETGHKQDTDTVLI